jgi:hypothetical protein
MVPDAPQCWAGALSLCFCFLHLILSIIALAFFLFYFFAQNFASFGFFMPPSFVWAPSID